MATLQELEQALIKADQKGDEEAVRVLAGEIRRFQSQASQPAAPQQPQERGMTREQPVQRSPGWAGAQQQVARGAVNKLADIGAGILDTGAAATDALLRPIDWATGDWSFPEQLRESNQQAREQFRGGQKRRNEAYRETATPISDASAGAVELASYGVPAARIDKAAKGLGALRRGFAQAAGGMGTNAVLQSGEGNEDINTGENVVTGAAAFAAEIISPVLARFGRWGLRNLRQQAQGGKAEFGRQLAREAGYDEISDDAAIRIANAAEEVEAGANPDVVVFEQLSGVRQSRAAKTGDRQAFREEEFLESVGDERFVNFRNAQRNDIERLASQQTNDLYSPQTAIDDIRGKVVAARDAAKAQADEGWRFADNADLTVSGQVGQNFQRHLKDTLGRQIVTKNVASDAKDVLERVNQILVRKPTQKGPQILSASGQPMRSAPEVADLNFNQLDEARRFITEQLADTTDPKSRRAIGAAKEALERTFDDIGEEVVLSGDVQNIKRLQDAVGGTRAFHQRFSRRFTDDKVGQYVERMVKDDNIDALSGFLIGSSSLPVRNSAYAAKAVKRALGDDTDALRNLQDAVLYRAFRDQAGNVSGEQAIANNLKKLLRERGELMEEIFTTRERSQLELMARGFESMVSPFRSSGTTERKTAFDAIIRRAPFGERLAAMRDALNQRKLANRAIGPMQLQSTAPALPAAAGASASNQSSGQ